MTKPGYWSSSPDSVYNHHGAWRLYTNNYVSLNNGDFRDESRNSVRCLKNNTPPTLKYRWQTDSTCSTDESDYTSTSRDSYDASNTTATATVTTS